MRDRRRKWKREACVTHPNGSSNIAMEMGKGKFNVCVIEFGKNEGNNCKNGKRSKRELDATLNICISTDSGDDQFLREP
ncbi:conserved hypothetical protein [Ricinus communis]|uniref:Uncharacterized protein n=1 Tax=Ricinus communis TaxID=3988 RepID=B9SWR6_RICCO|nr:conserved hypothetical protein [Ricinus communis]